MFSLKDKRALVTGAGRGIGRAIAEGLGLAGAAVFVNDVDAGVSRETEEILRVRGAHALGLAGDLTEPGFPQRLVETMLAKFGGVDIIVNNAGYTWDNVIQKTADEQFQAMLDIHAVAPFRILRAVSGWMRETAKKEAAAGERVMRKVVNISSISGTDGNAGQAGYASGKAAVVGLTKTMAKEWGRYNVNVNCVAFGLIDTRLMTPIDSPEAKIEMKGREIRIGVQPGLRDAAPNRVPLGRLGTPEEAAGAVLFFCSPLSDYVSGEVLVVSGGARF